MSTDTHRLPEGKSLLQTKRGVALEVVLEGLRTRPDVECEGAWLAMEELVGMASIGALAQLVRNGHDIKKLITERRELFFRQGHHFEDTNWEVCALAMEHVRRNSN